MKTLRQWLTENKLDGKLIITDNKENITRLFRRFNNDGIDLCNVTISTIDELAGGVYMEDYCKTSLKPIRMLDNNAGALLLQSLVTKNPSSYSFIPNQCYSIGTFNEVLRIMNIIRCSSVKAEYNNSTDEKIGQLKMLIDAYEQELRNKKLLDMPMLLKTTLTQKGRFCFSKIAIVYFGYLSYLENEFIGRYFPDKEEVAYSENNHHQISFVKTFGIYNEIKRIADQIQKEKYRFGDVSLIYSNREYDPIIEAIFKEQKIDFAFSCGKSAQSDNLVMLMRGLLSWISYNYDYAHLYCVIATDGFNVYGLNEDRSETCKLISEYNSYLRYNFCFGAERYLSETVWNKNKKGSLVFKSAIQQIVECFANYKDEVSIGDFLKKLADCAHKFTYDYEEKENHYHKILKIADGLSLTEVKMDLNKALVYLNDRLKALTFSQSLDNTQVDVAIVSDDVYIPDRKHTFLVGLSDKAFTASTVESPVLSDDEIDKYLCDVPKASGHEARHQHAYDEMISSARGDISISFADFSTVDMRAQAHSAYFASLLEREGKELKEIDSYHEYTDKLSCNLLNNQDNIAKEEQFIKTGISNDDIIEFAPTSLNTLMKCPLKYYYQVTRGLNMDEPVENSEIQWLQANETGTFFHNMMEAYMNQEFKGKNNVLPYLNDAFFNEVFEKEKQRTIASHPPLNGKQRDFELKRLKNAAQKYLKKMHTQFSQKDNQWIVEGCEMNLKDKNFLTEITESGTTLKLRIKGTADRVDYRVDEKGIRHYRIVDYKTGKRKSQADKVKKGDTCQHELYRMVISKMGHVDEFVYAFPFETKNDELTVTEFECRIPQKAREAIVNYYINNQIIPDQKEKKEDLGCEYCSLRHCCMFYTTREGKGD